MIIDCHVHLLPRDVQKDRSQFIHRDFAFASLYSSEKAKLASGEQIIEYLDKSAIDRAVVFGFPWVDSDLIRRNNDEVWDFHHRNPDRIIPFAVLSPRGNEADSLEAERTIADGFVGIGELAMYHGGWSPENLEAISPCLSVAEETGAPVMIHVNEPVGHSYPGKIPIDFQGLLRLISARPAVNFILAHFGGGIFIYGLMPEVGKILTHTYFDTAASPFLYDFRVFEVACRILGPEKIVFGSDFPLLSLPRYLKELDKTDLDETIRDGILGKNVLKLLGKDSRFKSAVSR
jgi:predicted TIM-barrel fold metal-dependent hydrolase